MRDPTLAVLSPGTSFHARYSVVRCLASGGMGVVYEVLDERTDAPRALKVLLPNVIEDPHLRARFAQEARITGAIESEHIVRTIDAGVDEETGIPFLVMELLRGEDLGALLARRAALSPREVVTYLFQAALALDKTHAAGIVHRDLKPANLFLTRRDDGSPSVKILDFGIAKVLRQTGRGRTTKSMGTPLYMPPEQATGKGAIGPPADVYAIGHIAYTLLVGGAYWDDEWQESEAPLAFLAEVARGVREPASARANRGGVELSAAFDGWFLKATSVHPEERFASAGEAISALAESLDVPLPRPSMAEDEPPLRASAPEGTSTAPAFDTLPDAGTEPLTPALEGNATRRSGTTSAPSSRALNQASAPRRNRAILMGAIGVGVLGAGAIGVLAVGSLSGVLFVDRFQIGKVVAQGAEDAGPAGIGAPREAPSALQSSSLQASSSANTPPNAPVGGSLPPPPSSSAPPRPRKSPKAAPREAPTSTHEAPAAPAHESFY